MIKKGFVAGSFDLIHPGYIYMFEEIKKKCDYLIVGLQNNPSNERPNKISPILSLLERKKILESLVFIDEIICYETESELLEILSKTDIQIRFLGEDYKDSNFTGKELKIPICFIDRKHGWSTTLLKKLIKESYIFFENQKN